MAWRINMGLSPICKLTIATIITNSIADKNNFTIFVTNSDSRLLNMTVVALQTKVFLICFIILCIIQVSLIYYFKSEIQVIIKSLCNFKVS